MTDTKYQEGLHKHIKVSSRTYELFAELLIFPPTSLVRMVSLANLRKQHDWHSPVSMWGHNGRDEWVTDKHTKTIELGPPSESFFFQYFTKKIYLSRKFIKNIFNTYTLKRYGWFALHHFPTPQYFLHLSKKLLPAVVISLRMEEKQSMYRVKS